MVAITKKLLKIYPTIFNLKIIMIKLNLSCGFKYLRLGTRSFCKAPPESNANSSMSARYRPSELQKFILVWTKKFKTKHDIPKFVTADVIERSRSEARIKLANIMMLLTALASFGAIMAGKAAAKRGDSVQKMNLDWHKQYEEEFKKKESAK